MSKTLENTIKIPDGEGYKILFCSEWITITYGILIDSDLYILKDDVPVEILKGQALTHNRENTGIKLTKLLNTIQNIDEKWEKHSHVPILMRNGHIIKSFYSESGNALNTRIISIMKEKEYLFRKDLILDKNQQIHLSKEPKISFTFNYNDIELSEKDKRYNYMDFFFNEHRINQHFFKIEKEHTEFYSLSKKTHKYEETSRLPFGYEHINDPNTQKIPLHLGILQTVISYAIFRGKTTEHEAIAFLSKQKEKTPDILPILREALMIQNFNNAILEELNV